MLVHSRLAMNNRRILLCEHWQEEALCRLFFNVMVFRRIVNRESDRVDFGWPSKVLFVGVRMLMMLLSFLNPSFRSAIANEKKASLRYSTWRLDVHNIHTYFRGWEYLR
jgi:hypothetical protein